MLSFALKVNLRHCRQNYFLKVSRSPEYPFSAVSIRPPFFSISTYLFLSPTFLSIVHLPTYNFSIVKSSLSSFLWFFFFTFMIALILIKANGRFIVDIYRSSYRIMLGFKPPLFHFW